MSERAAPVIPRRFKPYPVYKDSGVEWLGEIPAHWGVLALKRRANRIQTGTTPPTSETKYYENGTIAWYGPGSFADDLPLQAPIKFISESAVGDGVTRVFESGSAVVVTIGATIGKVAYMEQAGSFNQQITGVTFDLGHVLAKYGAYQLKRLEPVLRGIAPNTTLPILDQEEVGYLPFVVPPQSEQRAIAAFLDRETARIDALVAKKERLIELLQEKRTALIARAVTKGLDPNVPMKDSGVKWLGEVPAHWEVNRTKFAARLRSGHTPSRQHPEYWQDCTIPWFGLADVWQIRDGQTEYVTETAEKISELGLASSAARLLPKGTVMLSRTASVGFSVIMGIEMATTQDFVNWVCGPTLRPEYLLYVFRSMHHEFHRLTMGSTHQTIYMPDVGQFSTPIPPIQDQERIIEFVREHAKQIDALAAKVREAIDRFKELRTALISAAVTGKIDVREEVA